MGEGQELMLLPMEVPVEPVREILELIGPIPAGLVADAGEAREPVLNVLVLALEFIDQALRSRVILERVVEAVLFGFHVSPEGAIQLVAEPLAAAHAPAVEAAENGRAEISDVGVVVCDELAKIHGGGLRARARTNGQHKEAGPGWGGPALRLLRSGCESGPATL